MLLMILRRFFQVNVCFTELKTGKFGLEGKHGNMLPSARQSEADNLMQHA